jgi:DNA-binding NarL/FixJ family response regulator
MADSLRKLASGWPAVIGLAHITPMAIWPDGSAAEELYQYFVEEVYRNLGSQVERDLEKLVIAPRLDRELARRLMRDAALENTVAAGVEAGILSLRGNEFEFHPLARSFIENRRRRTPISDERIVRTCLDAYRERHDWDSAFELVERHGTTDGFEAIFVEALDEMLEVGRLTTIETWLTAATQRGEPSAPVKIAATEVALRRGQLSVAETLVQGVLGELSPGSSFYFRSLMLAGQIAHLDGREHEASTRYSQAEAVAPSNAASRDARWGRCMTLAALEDDRAMAMLDDLVADAPGNDPREQVRAADKQISIAVRFGALPSLARARSVTPLLDMVGDQSVRCSFLSVFSGALVLAAHYDDALSMAGELIRDAVASHSFGLTYGYANSALALAGQKRFVKAHALLDQAYKAAGMSSDAYGLQNVYTTRVRLLLQQRRIPEACLLEPPDVSNALPGMRGEVFGCRALALAAVGRAGDALDLSDDAARSSRALEAAVLAAAVRAVVDVRAGDDHAFGSAATLLEEASARGAVDLFVTAYRAVPDILTLLLASPKTRDRALFAVGRAGDREMAATAGVPVESMFDPVAALSPRERDVYALLCEGLSDREIAKLLYIAPGTTKSHTHSILEKTGFKSRRALMLDAARRQQTQAAPTATDENDRSGDS